MELGVITEYLEIINRYDIPPGPSAHTFKYKVFKRIEEVVRSLRSAKINYNSLYCLLSWVRGTRVVASIGIIIPKLASETKLTDMKIFG